MLELCDAELELGDGLTRSDTKLLAESGRSRAGGFTHSLELTTPALQHVNEDGAGLVPVDAESLGELVREIIHPIRSERERAYPGERERLEHASGRFRPRSGRL